MGFFSELDIHMKEMHDYTMEQSDSVWEIQDDGITIALFFNIYDAYLFMELRKDKSDENNILAPLSTTDLVALAATVMRDTDGDPSDDIFLKRIRDEIAKRKPERKETDANAQQGKDDANSS